MQQEMIRMSTGAISGHFMGVKTNKSRASKLVLPSVCRRAWWSQQRQKKSVLKTGVVHEVFWGFNPCWAINSSLALGKTCKNWVFLSFFVKVLMWE